jgi:hypothetical protein
MFIDFKFEQERFFEGLVHTNAVCISRTEQDINQLCEKRIGEA